MSWDSEQSWGLGVTSHRRGQASRAPHVGWGLGELGKWGRQDSSWVGRAMWVVLGAKEEGAFGHQPQGPGGALPGRSLWGSHLRGETQTGVREPSTQALL